MREIHSTKTFKASHGHAAYVLTAEGALSSHHDLYEYLCDAANRPVPHNIRPQLISAHSNQDSFCAKFLQLEDGQVGQIKKQQKLFTGGGIKDWSLTAIEVIPGKWRLHLVNHSLYRRYQDAIKKARQNNADYRYRTDREIAVSEKIVLFYETFVCCATNPELVGGIVTVNFDVPRYLSAGTDSYTLGFNAEYTTIGEPAGFGQRCLKIPNNANPDEYVVEVIEIQ